MTVINTIQEKIRQFFDLNEEAKAAKKILDPLNKEIKEELRTTEGNILEIDGIEARLSVQNRTSVDDEKLLKKLKKLKRKDLIKKIEIPDHAQIEKLIYDQELDGALLEDCIVTKAVEVLTVAKAKKKKENEDGEN